MKIQAISKSINKDKFVIYGEITLKSGKRHVLYFEVDKKHKDFLAEDASSFFAAALPVAMFKHEDIEIEGSISEKLLESAPEIMKIIEGWNNGLDSISITAGKIKKDAVMPKNSACFFSAGVDSFFTYLKNKNKINYLIFVHGYDINVNDNELYINIEKNIDKIVEDENIKIIKVKTNIREIYEQYFDWNMAHEFALASVTLLLRKGFKEIFMSCGQTDLNAPHSFMSPQLDILWSTEYMKTHHYGCKADKITKLAYLSRSALPMENLRVCWLNKNNEYNCGECEKCMRNMLALYVSGSLKKCKTFKKDIQIEILKNIHINEYDLKYFITAYNALKNKNDKSEIFYALGICIRNNQTPPVKKRVYRNLRSTVRYFDKKYNRNRLYWFLAQNGHIV